MAAPRTPPPSAGDGDQALSKVSKHGEMTEKSLKNLINLDNEADYFGEVDPTGTFGVDPLYGPDTIPSRGPVRVESLGVARLWRSTNLDDPWGPYRVTWTKVIYGMYLGGLFGFAGATLKVFGNAALATLGVVTIPIKMAQEGEIYPKYSAYFKYTAYRLREKYGFQQLWDKFINKADELKLPKLKSAERFANVDRRDKIAMWRFAKTVPGFYDYYRPYSVPPPVAPFPEKFTFEEQRNLFLKATSRMRRWYLTHPMKVMANDFRRESGMHPKEPLSIARRGHFFARYLVPKMGYAGFCGLLILRFIAKHGRPNAKRWLYLFTIVGTNIWVAQQLTPNKIAEKHKGPTLMAGAIAGWLQYRLFVKNIDHLPRIPPRYWPGIVAGWLITSAALDFMFVGMKQRGEQLDLTSTPMMAATHHDPTEVLPVDKLHLDKLKEIPGIIAAEPQKMVSRSERAEVEVAKIREEMKRDGASNPFPYFWRHIQAIWREEHPNEESSASVIKRYEEWREELKREYDAVRQMNAEDAVAEQKRKKSLEEARKAQEEAKRTIVITAAGPKKPQE